ncbi:MAG: NifB/NifX family molybdenum-iron cluster-binding protein [Thermodesulfobacteriota bacterium]
MKVAIPVVNDEGVESEVFGHFGSAPSFIFVDLNSGNITSIKNNDQHHSHGACNPMKALNDTHVDAIVVGGIGGGALNRLNQMGIAVYQAQSKTVKENIALLKTAQLPRFLQSGCCSHQGHECGHSR